MSDPVLMNAPTTLGAQSPQAKYITTSIATTAKSVTVPTAAATSIADPSTGNTGATCPIAPFNKGDGSMPTVTGCIVQADPANTAPIEVGYGAFAFGDGMSLSAGDSRKFPVSDAGMIFCIAGVANQKLRFLVE
jgi:chitodextrinase